MNVVASKSDFCMKCIDNIKKRDNEVCELNNYFMAEQKRIEHAHYKSCDKEKKTQMLIQDCDKKRQAIEDSMFRNCLRTCVQKVQGGTGSDAMDCEIWHKFQEELRKRDKYIKYLEDENNKTRSELDHSKRKYQVFRERMSVEASVEIGTSGEIFEDISNPCRESELRSSYNKMRTTMWPKCLKEIEKKMKESKEETVDKSEEKEKIRRMIKEVFTKAANDMKEKKTVLESFFEISDKTAGDRKQKQCFEMAVQSLQLMIFWKECTLYQDMYKQLGHSSPDYLCNLADQCYKQGCLMALHNPPLTLDWNTSDDPCPFPPITKSMLENQQIDIL